MFLAAETDIPARFERSQRRQARSCAVAPIDVANGRKGEMDLNAVNFNWEKTACRRAGKSTCQPVGKGTCRLAGKATSPLDAKLGCPLARRTLAKPAHRARAIHRPGSGKHPQLPVPCLPEPRNKPGHRRARASDLVNQHTNACVSTPPSTAERPGDTRSAGSRNDVGPGSRRHIPRSAKPIRPELLLDCDWLPTANRIAHRHEPFRLPPRSTMLAVIRPSGSSTASSAHDVWPSSDARRILGHIPNSPPHPRCRFRHSGCPVLPCRPESRAGA